MLKPYKLNKGDKVAIVSLSRGLLGMPFCSHQLELGIKRLEEMGLVPVVMPNALKELDYLANHPEERASDLKRAFMDDEIKGIICAIGGDDTYKTIPYLLNDGEFKEAVINHPKIFTGYSDTTNNHLMLNKLGLSTFYGPNILNDIAELDNEMIPYTKAYFNKFFENEDSFEITSSPLWYEERTEFGKNQLGQPRVTHKEEHGYETINGGGVATGKLYGGCLESIYDGLTGGKYGDEAEVFKKYEIFPTDEEWKEKILFLETSDGKPTPNDLEKMLMELKNRNILRSVKGLLVGKPQDEEYYDEYKEVYKRVFCDLKTPVLFNLNFGHAYPRCIVPYDAETVVDYDNKKVIINSPIFETSKK